jgi:Holliday junction resolvase-like predicted endonuclease
MLTNSEKGKLGEEFVRRWLCDNGYVIDSQRENGCDMVAEKDGERIRIEVKTTSDANGGIPDMHDTEFEWRGDGWYFVADYLYIVRLNDRNEPVRMDVLSKEEIDSLADKHRAVSRIRVTALGRAVGSGKLGRSINM